MKKKVLTLHPDGRVEGADEVFALPATIAGMQERMIVLKEQIDHIRDQIRDPLMRAQFDSDDKAYYAWKRKAHLELNWKRTERAWLVDKFQAATEAATEGKRHRRSQYSMTAEQHAEAVEKRKARLQQWIDEHGDDELILLLLHMYRIVISIDGGDQFDEDELEAIRVTRDYLRLNGIDGQALRV